MKNLRLAWRKQNFSSVLVRELIIPRVALELFPALVCCVLVAQLCLTLRDPMDWSLQGSSVHEILQERILEWVAIPFSRKRPDPGVKPCIAGRFFTTWNTKKAILALAWRIYLQYLPKASLFSLLISINWETS